MANNPPDNNLDTPNPFSAIVKTNNNLSLIGMVAISWSTLERCVDVGIWRFVGGDVDPIACLTSQMLSVRSKLTAFEALAQLRSAPDAELKKIRAFKNELEGPSRFRNKIIHSPFGPGKDGKDNLFPVFIDKRLQNGATEFNPTEVIQFCKQMHAHSVRFMHMLKDLADKCPLLPGSSREQLLSIQIPDIPEVESFSGQ